MAEKRGKKNILIYKQCLTQIWQRALQNEAALRARQWDNQCHSRVLAQADGQEMETIETQFVTRHMDVYGERSMKREQVPTLVLSAHTMFGICN